MLSALIPSAHSYPAMLLAEQLVHQRCVHPGPLVLRTAPLKFPAPTTDRDRTVSRRCEPSSRTALMGEQPNPWPRLQPQSICPPDTVSHPDKGRGLECQYSQGSIPPTPPPKLALRFLRLLPILYKLYQNSISGYSKAPRGLSVLSRVTCIFTGTIISPSLWLRQCPNRYTFRAGRNLPDKEFRYLRTVIVTAAVYWGFSSELRLR